ncbi:MAG TPA: glycosyltransferase [Ohtaekwangia sp.]
MRISYYFRHKAPGNYSIENVFDPLISEIASHETVSVFHTRKATDLMSIFRVSQIEADIHHITGAENYLAMGLRPDRTILTVHDIGHFTETLNGFRKYVYRKLYWDLPPVDKLLVTTVSAFTKEQLIRNFSLREERVHVIPNPLRPLFEFDKKAMSARPVILQVGGGKNKNVESLIEAVDGLDVKLLLVRRPEAWLTDLLTRRKIDHEFRYDLTDEEMVRAYKDCDMLFFASTYEGFGLPIIEAQAVGRPVITSNVTSMPEVLKEEGSAILVNPFDIKAIREAIIRLAGDKAFHAHTVSKGLHNITFYSVRHIAMQYLNLYNELYGER